MLNLDRQQAAALLITLIAILLLLFVLILGLWARSVAAALEPLPAFALAQAFVRMIPRA